MCQISYTGIFQSYFFFDLYLSCDNQIYRKERVFGYLFVGSSKESVITKVAAVVRVVMEASKAIISMHVYSTSEEIVY